MQLTTWSIVNNEIDFLPLVISYTLKFVDNLYILDTGSNDGSWEYLQDLTRLFNNIHVEKYHQIFIPQYDCDWKEMSNPFPEVEVRNYALQRTKEIFPQTDWLIQLDGDEVFLAQETRSLIEKYHQDSQVSSITLSTINPVCELKFHPIECRSQLIKNKSYKNDNIILYDPHARIWRKDSSINYCQNPEIKDQKQYHCIPVVNNKHVYYNSANIFLEDKVHFHLHWLYGKKIESYYYRKNITKKEEMIANQYNNDYSSLLPQQFYNKRQEWLSVL